MGEETYSPSPIMNVYIETISFYVKVIVKEMFYLLITTLTE